MPVSLVPACSCQCDRYWMAPGRCQTMAMRWCSLVPRQELIRGYHSRHRARQHLGRLFAHWPPATHPVLHHPCPTTREAGSLMAKTG